MRKSLAAEPARPPDKATARACLVTNLLVLPGLGSITGGRKAVGYAQAALALLGFAGTLGWLLLYVWEWVELGELPLTLNGTLLLGVASVAVFVTAWLWGLQTGLQLQRAARARTERPAAPPRLDAPAARVPPRLPSDPDAQHPKTP